MSNDRDEVPAGGFADSEMGDFPELFPGGRKRNLPTAGDFFRRKRGV